MENALLKSLADNKPLMEEVKKYLLAEFDVDTTSLAGLDDKALGERVRAKLTGSTLVEGAFRKLEALRSTPNAGERPNPGR